MKSVAAIFSVTFVLLLLTTGQALASIHIHSSFREVSASVFLEIPSVPPPDVNSVSATETSAALSFTESVRAHLAKGSPLRDGEAIASIDSSSLAGVFDVLLITAIGATHVDYDNLQGNELAHATGRSRLLLSFSVDTPSTYSFSGSLTESANFLGSSLARLTDEFASSLFFFEGPASGLSSVGLLLPGVVYKLDVDARVSRISASAGFDFAFSISPIQADVPEPASVAVWMMLTLASVVAIHRNCLVGVSSSSDV